MRPGDIYWFNDCYASKGAVSHSPDQVFLAPVFADGKLSAFAQSWAHFNDIGGMRPGSLSPDCTDIFQEGIIVPPVRVVREGVVAEELLRMFFRNSRFPEMVKGDTRASMAAIRLGERRLAELFQRFGRGVTIGAFDRLIDESEARAAPEAARARARGRARLHRHHRQRRPGPRAHQAALPPGGEGPSASRSTPAPATTRCRGPSTS